jgi:AcrR family transcriptional regulator
MAATADVLADAGYDGLTIEEVATRAGVHKTTVYRRWPTKAELVSDALRARSDARVPVPDTGTLEGDLRALARSVVANIGSRAGRSMTRTLVAASATNDQVAAATVLFWHERLALTGAIVERAIARGELAAGTDSALVIETLIGAFYVRLLLTGEPINRAVADHVAGVVAAGALSSWAQPRS